MKRKDYEIRSQLNNIKKNKTGLSGGAFSEKCHKCGSKAYKSCGESKLWCEKCISKSLNGEPVLSQKKQNRNDKCDCGSGIKFKNCCIYN